MEEKETDNIAPAEPAQEPIVQFKLITDRSMYEVRNPEINKRLVEISGYDLKIAFNLQYIRSVEDVEGVVEAMGKMFRDIIMDQLLNKNDDSDVPLLDE
jgi:hypothetical protein